MRITMNVIGRRRSMILVAVVAICWSLSLFATGGMASDRSPAQMPFVFEGEQFGRPLAGDVERRRLSELIGPIDEVMLQSRGDVSNRLVQIYGCRHLGRASSAEADKAVEAICAALERRYGLVFRSKTLGFREGMRRIAVVDGIGVLVRWHSNFFQDELVADMTLRNFEHEIQPSGFSVGEVLGYRFGETLEGPAEMRQKFWKFERIVPQCRSEHVIDGIYAVHDVSGLDRAAAVAEFEEARSAVEKLHGIRLYKTVDYDDIKRYDFDGKDVSVSVKFEYLEKKEVRYSVCVWDGAEDRATGGLRDGNLTLIFSLLAFASVLVLVWFCVAVGRYAVGRLEFKRLKEQKQTLGICETGVVFSRKGKLMLALGLFLVGAFAELLVSGWQDCDPIFRQYVPWCGIFNVLLSGIMLLSVGLAVSDIAFPRTFLRTLLWILAVLEMSFVIHLADAFSFWGYGMSFVACVRGFARRFCSSAAGVALIAVLMAFSVPLVFCMKPVRRMMTRCNLTCAGYLDNLLNLVVWIGLLGLLVYEALILIWLNFAL